MADQKIMSGGYEQIADSDLICITAGLRRKPDESRLDLINRNVDLFMQILEQVKGGGLRRDAIVLVVSNPVDVLTYLAAERLGLPPSQVIGLGTQLDTIRFRSLIAQHLKAAPTQVSALILGEHGDSMVPIWSSAGVGGLPLEKQPGWTPHIGRRIVHSHQGIGRRSHQEEGWRRFRCRHRHPGSHRVDRARSAPRAAGLQLAAGLLRACATFRSRCPRSSAAKASSPRKRSSSGRKKSKASARADKSCGKRLIRCLSRIGAAR